VNAGHKVVVFSEHTESLHNIANHFKERAVLLDGQTPQHERDPIVQQFQSNPACRVFCGNIKAAGVGITLTAASYAVVNDSTWLPSDMTQAEDRLHRIGQKCTVNIYKIVDKSLLIDKIICQILEDRSAQIASFEGVKNRALQLAKEYALALDGKTE
jgi:SWI/SNF-related matrix-associated actin-dependent regulator 1 of chromatin subfamily A